MLIIPSIDIKGGKCVRLLQGNFNHAKIYSNDPVCIAKRWEKEDAKILHVVDLDGAKDPKTRNLDLIVKIANAVKIKVQVGGGIRNEKDIKQMLNAGIARIVIGTTAIEDKDFLQRVLRIYNDKIAIALDAKNGKLMIKGWLKETNEDVIKKAKEFESFGTKQFIFTDIKRDGTLTQPNYKTIKSLIKTVSVPVIASGGITTLTQIKKLKSIGVEGIIIGKALYEKRINLKEAINVS